MILIIQNGFIPPSITDYLDQPYEIIKSFESNTSKIDINKYSIIIILGGSQSVTNISYYPYLYNVIELIKKCISLNKKLIGICLGCQLIAHALGCEIRSTGKLNIGYNVELLGYKNIFRCHIDYIVPNENITVLEYFESMPYLFTHKNIIGIQCHPDTTPISVQQYCNNMQCYTYAKNNKDIIEKQNKAMMDHLLIWLNLSIN